MSKSAVKKIEIIILITALLFLPALVPAVQAGELPDGTGIRIAVIDTGVLEAYAGQHPGRIETGINYVFPEQGRADKIGHGTRVISLILGAETETGTVAGTAPGATVVPLVYQSRYPSGVTNNGGVALLSRAIREAVDVYGCRVLCISSGTVTDDGALRAATAYAEEKGTVVVAAVGNDQGWQPDRSYYPACYETVIGTGAVDEQDVIADFSQQHGVFTVTSGKKIQALALDGTVRQFSGTSYAAAIVAGIAATLLSAEPGSTPPEIRSAIALSAEDLGEAGLDPAYGWGKIDTAAALTLLRSWHEENRKEKSSNVP